MNSLSLFFAIFLVILFLFIIVNMTIFKNVERYGVYCGRYNLDPKTAQKNCNSDSNCKWNSFVDGSTGITNSWCSNTPPTASPITSSNQFTFFKDLQSTIEGAISIIPQPSWVYTPSLNKWYTPYINTLVGKWDITKVKSSSNMTVSFWININNMNSDYTNIFHITNNNENMGTSGSRVPGMWLWPNSTKFMISNDIQQQNNAYLSTPEVKLNTPTFITITWNNRTVTYYNNGVAQATQSWNSPFILADSTANFYLRDIWYTNNVNNFEIKNFSFYDYALSQPDISYIYVKQNIESILD